MNSNHTHPSRAAFLSVVSTEKRRIALLAVMLVLLSMTMLGGPLRVFAATALQENNEPQPHLSGRSAAGGTQPQCVKDELLVRFESGATKGMIAAANDIVGATEVQSFSVVPNLKRVKLPQGMSVQKALELYRAHPDIKYA